MTKQLHNMCKHPDYYKDFIKVRVVKGHWVPMSMTNNGPHFKDGLEQTFDLPIEHLNAIIQMLEDKSYLDAFAIRESQIESTNENYNK